jgi:hypothetical protein
MNAQEIYTTAREAGLAAAAAAQVQPMIIQQHKNMLDDNSPVVKQYFVSDGVCGFASVVVRNIKFANQLKKLGIGRKNYGTGWNISVSDFNQSLQRKEAYAYAFAGVLRAAGIDATVDSRMD